MASAIKHNPVFAANRPGLVPNPGTPSGTKFLRDDATFQTVASVSPGGSSGAIQYNNAGAFGGSTTHIDASGNLSPVETIQFSGSVTGAGTSPNKIDLYGGSPGTYGIGLQGSTTQFFSQSIFDFRAAGTTIGTLTDFSGLTVNTANITTLNLAGDFNVGGHKVTNTSFVQLDGSVTGGGTTPNKIDLYSTGVGTYGLGIQANTLQLFTNITFDFRAGGTTIATLDATGMGLTGTIKPGTFTVAGLPSGSAGQVAFASNGRNPTEGAGAGTGTAVYYNGTFGWCLMGTKTPVTA